MYWEAFLLLIFKMKNLCSLLYMYIKRILIGYKIQNKMFIAVHSYWLMLLAWLIFPGKCGSESCAYSAILAGIVGLIIMIIVSILILINWSRIAHYDNNNSNLIKSYHAVTYKYSIINCTICSFFCIIIFIKLFQI